MDRRVLKKPAWSPASEVTTFRAWLTSHIVAATISARGQHLRQLAAIALIRPFLNVFLARETAVERPSL